jgi:hypothetical protein
MSDSLVTWRSLALALVLDSVAIYVPDRQGWLPTEALSMSLQLQQTIQQYIQNTHLECKFTDLIAFRI